MMEPGVYIVDLTMKAVPTNKSRLHPVTIFKEKYPVRLDKNGNISEDRKRMICKKLLKEKSVNYDRYIIRLTYVNPKFSSKIYGS